MCCRQRGREGRGALVRRIVGHGFCAPATDDRDIGEKPVAASMIGDMRPVSVKVNSEPGVASSSAAVSIGLIVTELVINALKHAFPDDKADGQIVIAYDSVETNWKLTVSDNGIGKADGAFDKTKSGLGTSLIEALAKQLDARVDVLTNRRGTTVSIAHGTFTSQLPAAA
jgi:two-component sensor histidine kinase